MADFGEYLPTDAIVKSGQAADRLHNAFPTLWAQVGKSLMDVSMFRWLSGGGLSFAPAGCS
jgi:hypothetical protein